LEITVADRMFAKGLMTSAFKVTEFCRLTLKLVIKVKFLQFKEKEIKKEIVEAISKERKADLVGMVGHMAIFFRPQPDPERRRIDLSL
jgi:RNA-binding protein YhbY